MKIPDFTGSVYRTKPWIPPPARTSKEEKPARTNAGTPRVATPDYSQGFISPLHESNEASEIEDDEVDHSVPPPSHRAESDFAAEIRKRDSSTLTEVRSSEAEVQTDAGVPVLERLKSETLNLQEMVELQKLSQVVCYFEEECSGFREALEEREGHLKESQQALSIFLGHLHGLRATLALAGSCAEAHSVMWHEEQVPEKLKTLKASAARVRSAISCLVDGEKDHTVNFRTLPLAWEHLINVLLKLENKLSEAYQDKLTTRLRHDIEAKDKQIVHLEKELQYHKSREEGEKVRQDRCLDLIQELQRKCDSEKQDLKKAAKCQESKASKYEETIRSLTTKLNDKERKLHNVTLECDTLRTTVDKMQLDKIDMERVLINLKSKIADLEPLILNPTANAQVQHLMQELGRYRDEIYHLRQRLQEVSRQNIQMGRQGDTSHAGTSRFVCELLMLKEMLRKSRDPGTRHLVAAVEKLEKQVPQLLPTYATKYSSSDRSRVPLDVVDADRHLQGMTPEYDPEKEQLAAKVEELQAKLDRMAASNRSLSSYIATLRRSYAAVFCQSPDVSQHPSLGKGCRQDSQ